MPPNIPADSEQNREGDENIEAAQTVMQSLPMLAKFKPQINQKIRPDKRTNKGGHCKRPKRHAGYAGRNRNISAHNRQHAPEKSCPAAKLFKKPIGSV